MHRRLLVLLWLPAELAIRGTVALNVLWAGPFGGVSMNPARSFGPVLISGVWSALWICWVSPTAGATLRAIAYVIVRRS